jgi:biuret amidohydrolase
MTDFPLNPERTALLDIDMQSCFVADHPLSAHDGLVLLKRLNRLINVARDAGVLVIHTRHVLQPDGADSGRLRDFAPPPILALLHEGSASAELHPGLSRQPADLVLTKPRFGAFHRTQLEAELKNRRIDTVIIGGIATNVCCETTAREAAVRDFRVFFLSDGTATLPMGNLSADALQAATCTTLGVLFARVVTVDEMIDQLVRARALAS